MANERKTEQIVREHFSKYKRDCIIEEQQSDNPRINKLLRYASKKGSGRGYPEFIISIKDNPNFLIVVECKADIKNHKSKTLNQYSGYAVDGALLYAAYLSKEFDVLAIGISGNVKGNIRISHFLQLKNTKKEYTIFNDDSLLSIKDYLNGYRRDERKFNQDFLDLLKYSKLLNDKFHALKVKESYRSLLVSGTLISLRDDAFINSYRYKSPKALADLLVNTINEKLSETQSESVKDIISSYFFIKTHTILSRQDGKLREIIDEIDEKINSFIRSYKYFDTLGQFYIEFLRYANNDRGLGIVLTPPHVTELFCDMANINKNSVVLDTCAGTGGFLISAMKKMMIDAGGDSRKERRIKEKQVIGVEVDHEIYALLCSNMYIHDDGRSNLMKGDCFSDRIKNKISRYRPNVGFLNPPYKTNKQSKEELEFVLNNLAMLEKGSYCVAIVPVSCVMEDNKNAVVLKERLLQDHTLDASFSMPNDLFHKSGAGAHTVVLVFRAKEKHPDNYKTYFGYWKDDGFTTFRHIGRGDHHSRWAGIKEYWLDNYKNREDTLGHSIKKNVSHTDNWSVETYMKTNYREFSNEDFSETVHKHISFQFSSHNMKSVVNESRVSYDIDLMSRPWKYFKYNDVFSYIGRGKRLIEDKRIPGDVLYFSASKFNNGCTDSIANPLFVEFDALIYTTFGDAYFIKGKFTASDEISIFKNESLNVFNGLFLATVISKNKYKYSFGRKAFKNKFIEDLIPLPVKINTQEPDWGFMENFIKSLPYSSNL